MMRTRLWIAVAKVNVFLFVALGATTNSLLATPTPASSASSPVVSQMSEGVKWTDVVQTWGNLGTLAVTTIGFAILIHQLRQAKRSLHGSTHAAVYGQQHAINEFFTNQPDLWRYFYDNLECSLEDPNRPRLIAATYMIADFFEHLSQQCPNLPRSIWPAWKRYMRHVYKTSPILREHCTENRLWYDAEFIKMISTA